jgi:hypothetical protein
LRGGGSYDSFHGNVAINVVANAFVGNAAFVVVLADTKIPGDPSPASTASNYVSADNYFNPSTNAPLLYSMTGATTSGALTSRPSLPWNMPNLIPVAYQVTTLRVNQLAARMLPYAGAPNRTALDQQRIDEVAAQLHTHSAFALDQFEGRMRMSRHLRDVKLFARSPHAPGASVPMNVTESGGLERRPRRP